MATMLKEVDAVCIGVGFTGSILARELTKAGLKVEDFPKTIDGLPELCKTIKAKTKTLCDIRLTVNDLLSQMVYEGGVNSSLQAKLVGRGTIERRFDGGGVNDAGAFYPSTIHSAVNGSPAHELRSQGGTPRASEPPERRGLGAERINQIYRIFA